MEIRARGGDARIWEYRNVLVAPSVVAGMARDVTERTRGHRALCDSEAHFRALVENSPDLISIINTEGMVCYHSPAATGLAGKSVFDIVHPDDRAALLVLIRRAAEGRADVRMAVNGAPWRAFEVLLKPVTRGTRLTGFLLNARDVTERKMLEQQLEQTNRVDSLGRLAATVAHEFNNVLMGMQPFVELLQKRAPTPELVARATQHMLTSIQRGKCVTHDILRYTRPAEPAKRPVALHEWWNDFIAEAQAMIGDHIALTTSIDALTVMADPRQLSQALINLINNAGDAMRDGGELSVRVREAQPGYIANPSKFVQITVSDTGTGMPPEVLAHMFEPLFTTKANGTGLGLAVTHQLVTRHGGFIAAESVVGEGSSFHIFLPKAAEAAATATTTPLPNVAVRRLLIVDDEELIAVGLFGLLADAGFETTIASTGAAALDALDAFAPELVLLDIGLPDLDGTEVARRIHARRPKLPVIFMTGHGDARGDAMLQKPFELDELLQRIAELEQVA
jgi:PAS domain S-box-containing protein